MLAITGYSETAKIHYPSRIDKAFNAAVEQREYIAVVEPYVEWWNFTSLDNKIITKLPLGLSEWLEKLPQDIQNRNCTYRCPFSISANWIRTNTRQGAPYAHPYWKKQNIFTGVLSFNITPSVKSTANVIFETGERYVIGQYAAYEKPYNQMSRGKLVAAKIYNPKFQENQIYWVGNDLLGNTFDPAIVLLDATEAGYYLLDILNDVILPILHQSSVESKNIMGSNLVKRNRTYLLQTYLAVFKTAEARGKLLDILGTLSQFQKKLFEDVVSVTHGASDISDVVNQLSNEIDEAVKTLRSIEKDLQETA